MFNVPPIPTPPDTVKAPVEVDVEPKDDVTAKPEVDESSIKVFINGIRNTSFSYNTTFTAITFGSFTFIV